MNLTGYNQYRENSAVTAQPEELTLMLYSGLIKFIMKAQYSIAKNDLEGAHINILKSQNIIIEFMSTLNQKYEVSSNMLLLYDYMHRRLIDANVQKSEIILEEVLVFARELRDTWEQAMKLAKHPLKKEAAAVVG